MTIMGQDITTILSGGGAMTAIGFVGKIIWDKMNKKSDLIDELDRKTIDLESDYEHMSTRIDTLDKRQKDLENKVVNLDVMINRVEGKLDLLIVHFLKEE